MLQPLQESDAGDLVPHVIAWAPGISVVSNLCHNA
jgi:hypothetical protein